MAAKDQEQSMEDILQSIKRIIAEEGDGESSSEPASAPAASAKNSAKPAPAVKPMAGAPVTSGAGSDILELTDILPADESDSASTFSVEEVMAIPRAEPMNSAAGTTQGGLISDDTLVTSAASLRSLDRASDTAAARHEPIASMPLRSGMTVEDLVIEALRPMLRSWLDANLPQLVERLVDREIRRISATSR